MFKKGLLSRDNSFVIIIAVAGVVLATIFADLIADLAKDQWKLNSIAESPNARWVRPSGEVETDRLEGLAGEAFNLYGSTNWVRAEDPRATIAEIARLNSASDQYVNRYGSTLIIYGGRTAAQQVEAARLEGIASTFVNLHGSTKVPQAVDVMRLDASLLANAERMRAAAGTYLNLYGSTPARYSSIERSRLAESSRMTGWAMYYGIEPDFISLDVAMQIGQ